MRKTIVIVAVLGWLVFVEATVRVRAADFRVENCVFVNSTKEPVAKSTTLFYRGTVYDFPDEPAEVTVFDPVENRFILLDVERRLKTELSTKTIDATLDRLLRLADTSKDAKIRFFHRPEFVQSIDAKTGELVFDSDWITYRVNAVAEENPTLTQQYRQFSDAYARLNLFLRPGSRPPYPRLIVNDVLEKRGEIPSDITLILKYQRGRNFRLDRIRSEHQFIKRLLESDRDRIVAAGEQMASFEEVGYREYEGRLEKATR